MTQLRHIGRRHVHLDVTDSTNNRAAAFANDPAHAGTVVTADHQAQGRGQHGRVWESPPGVSVLLSALIFPPPELRRPAILTAFAAVAVSETVRQVTARWSTIKWPNDVLIDGKKVAGILIECGVAPRTTDGEPAPATPHAVVGIGLNVNQTPDDFARLGLPDATSLLVVGGRPLSAPDVTRLLLELLDAEYGHLLGGELGDLESRWRERIGLLGKPVVVEVAESNEVRGRLMELTFHGVSVSQADGATRRFLPEEVRQLRSAEGNVSSPGR
jgi:BirA family transcriptional regulator, biotin operon repressor / biotin---[acetyl-CoA-carboxylase] ligase